LRSLPYLKLLAVILIVIAGLIMRIESVIKTHVLVPLSHDAGQYYQYGYNMRHHHIYSKDIAVDNAIISPDALRTPGYPIFLALFTNDVPNEKILSDIVLAQCLLSGVTLIFAFFLFQKFLSFFWSLASASLTAVSPHLIAANSYILTESLFCFILVLLCWQTSVFLGKPKILRAFLLGGICAFGALVRPSLNAFPIVFLVILVSVFHWEKGIKYFVGVFVGFILFFSPWIIRNIITLHEVSDSTLMAGFLHHGVYPDFMYEQMPETYGFPYRFDPRADEIGKNVPSVLKEIVNRIKTEPGRYVKWYILKKPMAFWSWGMVQGQDIFVYRVSRSPYFDNPVFQWTWVVMRSLHNALVVLCAVGCALAWLPNSFLRLGDHTLYTARFISSLLIYFTLLHMIGAPFPRYSVPLRPFLYGMAFFVPVVLRRRAENS
jgi:hypothetical protein